MSIIVIKIWFYTMWYGRDTCTENIINRWSGSEKIPSTLTECCNMYG